MKIINHYLDGSDQISKDFLTPNLGSEFSADPDTIVIHFTAGGSAESSARHLCKPSTKASAHIVLGRMGEVYQLAPFNRITWHAGRSTWKGRSGLNQYSIGIEVDNAGKLEKTPQEQFKTWFGKTVDANDVFEVTHNNLAKTSYWHNYTEEQIATVFDICELLVEKYPIKEIVGHQDISPSRKVDPGPAFPLARLRDRFLGEPRDIEAEDFAFETEGQALVNASKLNIRSGPGTTYPTVSEPVPRGEAVNVVSLNGGWAEIEYVKKGWVSSRYLNVLNRSKFI